VKKGYSRSAKPTTRHVSLPGRPVIIHFLPRGHAHLRTTLVGASSDPYSSLWRILLVFGAPSTTAVREHIVWLGILSDFLISQKLRWVSEYSRDSADSPCVRGGGSCHERYLMLNHKRISYVAVYSCAVRHLSVSLGQAPTVGMIAVSSHVGFVTNQWLVRS
jgi:hypothetical protein